MKTPDLLELLPVMLEIGAMPHACDQCGQLTGYSKGVRWQMVYCSNACRQKAYRIRNGQRYETPGRPAKS